MAVGAGIGEVVIKETSSGEKVYDLEFGARKVRWPGRTELLTLVVVDGLGQNPLMLLTNCKMTPSRKSLWRIVKSYLSRWRVEETIRFINQNYGLEDIRVLKYERLRNLAMLVLVTAYFSSVYRGKRATLAILVQHIEQAAQRIYGFPRVFINDARAGSRIWFRLRETGWQESSDTRPRNAGFG